MMDMAVKFVSPTLGTFSLRCFRTHTQIDDSPQLLDEALTIVLECFVSCVLTLSVNNDDCVIRTSYTPSVFVPSLDLHVVGRVQVVHFSCRRHTLRHDHYRPQLPLCPPRTPLVLGACGTHFQSGSSVSKLQYLVGTSRSRSQHYQPRSNSLDS